MKRLLTVMTALGASVLLAQVTSETKEAATLPALLPTTQPTTEPTTQPTTAPADDTPQAMDAEGALDRMLRARPGTARPIQPVTPQEGTLRPRRSDVAPQTPSVPLKREGDMIVQRVGHLQAMPNGAFEFRFDSDGRQLHDPPMTILPNRRLADMEAALTRAGGDLRFQVTGMVTQYRGRNYLLIEKAAEVVTGHEGL